MLQKGGYSTEESPQRSTLLPPLSRDPLSPKNGQHHLPQRSRNNFNQRHNSMKQPHTNKPFIQARYSTLDRRADKTQEIQLNPKSHSQLSQIQGPQQLQKQPLSKQSSQNKLGQQAKYLVHDQYRRSVEGSDNLERSFKIGNMAQAAIKWDQVVNNKNLIALEEFEQRKSMEKLLTLEDPFLYINKKRNSPDGSPRISKNNGQFEAPQQAHGASGYLKKLEMQNRRSKLVHDQVDNIFKQRVENERKAQERQFLSYKEMEAKQEQEKARKQVERVKKVCKMTSYNVNAQSNKDQFDLSRDPSEKLKIQTSIQSLEKVQQTFTEKWTQARAKALNTRKHQEQSFRDRKDNEKHASLQNLYCEMEEAVKFEAQMQNDKKDLMRNKQNKQQSYREQLDHQMNQRRMQDKMIII